MFQVVVAVEKDSAMAPKKVDYAVLHSTVGWPNSKCGFTKSFTKCMFFLIKWSSLSHHLIHQAFFRGSMLAAPLPFSRGSKKRKMQFENVCLRYSEHLYFTPGQNYISFLNEAPSFLKSRLSLKFWYDSSAWFLPFSCSPFALRMPVSWPS